MELLIKLSDGLDRFLTAVGRVAAWAGLCLVAVTIFDVVTRRFLILGSTRLQEAEWHFHVIPFALCLAYAYMKDTHVRIDLFRDRLPRRAQWWIELAGCMFFLLPYCFLVVYFAIDFTAKSFGQHEISSSATGLTHRWIIKSFVPIGFGLLALAGFTVVLRKIVELFGTSDQRQRVAGIEVAEAEHLDDVEIGRGESG